jgi:hypothetical protein
MREYMSALQARIDRRRYNRNKGKKKGGRG